MNIDPSNLNDAAHLRALADGEVARDQARPVDEDRLAFEVALRDSVGRVMGGEVRAPEALRASIGAMLERERVGDTAEDPSDIPGVITGAGDTTDRSFWTGARRLVPVAAVLALVVTVIGFGVSRTMGPSTPDAPFTTVQTASVRDFLPKAHTYSETCDDSDFAAKFQAKTIDDAVSLTDEHLRGVPAEFHNKLKCFTEAGFAFAGLGRCKVPGDGDSVHAYFIPDDGGQAISLFIQAVPTGGFTGMCEKHCYGASCDGSDDAGENLLVWKCGGYLYYLYSPDPGVTRAAGEAFDAPAKAAPLVRR